MGGILLRLISPLSFSISLYRPPQVGGMLVRLVSLWHERSRLASLSMYRLENSYWFLPVNQCLVQRRGEGGLGCHKQTLIWELGRPQEAENENQAEWRRCCGALWEKLESDTGTSGVSSPACLPSLGLKGCSSALWVVPDTGEGSCYAPERVFIQRTRDLCTKRALLAARGTTVACTFSELRRFKEDPVVPGAVSVEGPRHTSSVVRGKPKETSTFSKYLGGQTDGQESFMPLRWRW